MQTDDQNNKPAKPNGAATTSIGAPPTDGAAPPPAALGEQLASGESAISSVLGDLSEYAIAPDEHELEAIRVVQTIARKPAHDEWFRVSPLAEHTIDLLVLESSRDRVAYLVAKNVRAMLRANLKAKRVVVCANRYGDVFLWLVTLPAANGSPNPWITSAHRAVEHAMRGWTRIISNQRAGLYDIEVWPRPGAEEPRWPTAKIDELLGSAFAGRIITTVDHPVVRELKGEV